MWDHLSRSVPEYILHKQSFADVLQNRYSQKFRKFHGKTPVLESLLKRDSTTGVLKFAEFLRTPPEAASLVRKTGFVFRALSNIYDRASSRNNAWLKTVNYFREKAPSFIIDKVLHTPLEKYRNPLQN